MIIKGLLDLWFTWLNGVVTLLPHGPLPAGLSGLGSLAPLIANAQGVGSFVPWSLAIGVVGAVVSVWVVVSGIKFLRWLLAWVPTWGGS